MKTECARYRAAINPNSHLEPEPTFAILDHPEACEDCADWLDKTVAEGESWARENPEAVATYAAASYVATTPHTYPMSGPRGRA